MIFLSILTVTIEYSLACLCVGSLVVHAIPGRFDLDLSISAGIKLATAFILGQGILANIWEVIALYERFSPIAVGTIVFIMAIGGIALTYKLNFEFIHQLLRLYDESQKEPRGWKLIIVLTLLICAAGSTSLGRRPNVDGSAFYLAIAKVTADSHRLAPLPGFEELTSIGMQGEMHFAALMSMGSPGAAQLFSWPTILTGALLLLALAKNVGVERRGQWLVLAMLFTSSAVIELTGSGKTDLFATVLGLAAYYWAIRIREAKGSSIFWLVGLFTGLAVIAKISYVITFLPSIAIIIIWSYYLGPRQAGVYGLDLKKLLPCILVGTAGLLIAVFPHLVKNYILFENPFAPFGTGTTGFQDEPWYGPESTRRILFAIPLTLTFGDHWAQMGNLSPLVLAFFSLLPLLPKPRHLFNSPLIIITISAIVGIAAWFIVRPSVLAPRYFMACLLLLIIPAAKAAEFITSSEQRSKILHSTVMIITTLVIITSGLYHLGRTFFPKQTYAYLSGQLSECEKAPEYCGLLTVINESISSGGRLFTNTFFRYFLRSDLIQCALTTDETNAYFNLETSEQRWSFIYGRGFNYIPLFDIGNRLQKIVISDVEQIPTWLKITRIEDGNNVLLQLGSTDPLHKPVVGCGQISPPAWDLFNLSSF